MNDLTAFQFENKPVRTIDEDGTIWFVLYEVLEALETSSTVTQAKQTIIQGLVESDEPEELKRYINNISLKNKQNVFRDCVIISESALTFLISVSRTEIGKRFRRWIHNEVIPSIRKTGSYSSAPKTPLASSSELILMLAQANLETERKFNSIDERLAALESKQASSTNSTNSIVVQLMTVSEYLSLYHQGFHADTSTLQKLAWKAHYVSLNDSLPKDTGLPFSFRRYSKYTKSAFDQAYEKLIK